MVSINGLQKRAVLIQAVRDFFISRDYLEVETPIRIPAPAPEAHIEPVASGNWYLQTSPELCMKRLLAAGVPKLFQICKCFRAGERGRLHLSEFTMLEWYRTWTDYRGLMDECEELVAHVAEKMGQESIYFRGKQISVARGWRRMTVAEAFARYASMSLGKALENDMFEEELVTHVEPNLGIVTPTFLYDYPGRLGALARLKADNRQVAERFELYINGLEIANGFSELTDAVEQRARFEEEQQVIRRSGRSVAPMPESFLEALDAMPESAGIALGLDRLAIVFTDASTIDDVVTFRPEDL